MKKTELINSNVATLVANMGHTDLIGIGNAAIAVPKNISKVDLAVKLGLPSFIDVLKVVAKEAYFEEVMFTKEVMDNFPELVEEVKVILDCPLLKVSLIDEKEFKETLKECKGVIRTGENKLFHNVILRSGSTFI